MKIPDSLARIVMPAVMTLSALSPACSREVPQTSSKIHSNVIETLEGLEKLPNIKTLYPQSTKITSIEALKNLPDEVTPQTEITSIEALKNLPDEVTPQTEITSIEALNQL